MTDSGAGGCYCCGAPRPGLRISEAIPVCLPCFDWLCRERARVRR